MQKTLLHAPLRPQQPQSACSAMSDAGLKLSNYSSDKSMFYHPDTIQLWFKPFLNDPPKAEVEFMPHTSIFKSNEQNKKDPSSIQVNTLKNLPALFSFHSSWPSRSHKLQKRNWTECKEKGPIVDAFCTGSFIKCSKGPPLWTTLRTMGLLWSSCCRSRHAHLQKNIPSV